MGLLAMMMVLFAVQAAPAMAANWTLADPARDLWIDVDSISFEGDGLFFRVSHEMDGVPYRAGADCAHLEIHRLNPDNSPLELVGRVRPNSMLHALVCTTPPPSPDGAKK